MFFIVNKTKSSISIGELGVVLGPRQAIDLDHLVDRAKSDASKQLRAAISQGSIEVRAKDGIEKKRKEITTSSDSLDSFKKDILKELKQSIKEMAIDLKLPESNVTQIIDNKGLTKEDLRDMAEIIIKSLPVSNKNNLKVGEEIEINEDVLSEISARAVEKIVKNTEVKSVHYDEKIEKNTILDNIDELEDLLE